MRDLIEGQSLDLNVKRLRRSSSPQDYGTMLRLASEMRSLRDKDLSTHPDLWSCLVARGFDPGFVDSVAKPYWKRACWIVDGIPYSHIILDDGCRAVRRLMAHLLRSVCGLIEQESQGR
jgi:hypothetical protein